MSDHEPDLSWYYAIVGTNGSNIGMGRLLLAIGTVLVLAQIVITVVLG